MSKIFKHPERKNTVEVTNPNTYSVFIREGFIEEKAKKEDKK